MSLSVRTSAKAGNPLGGSEDWGDSPYGSLITLGPKTFKKKPVLVLAAEELAEAHMAMAMGGAEIMDMMPDPVAAPRPRQPSVILGLVPMGAEEPEEDRAAFAVPAEDLADDWVPLPDYDEPEEPEADIQTWIAEDEPDDWEEVSCQPVGEAGDSGAEDAFDAPGLGRLPAAAAFGDAAPQVAPEPQVPSIEEQLERMRERLAKRAAATSATDGEVPASPAEDKPMPTIERLEIDDWSNSASLKGFIPPQEEDLAPLPPPVSPPAPPIASEPQMWLEPEPEPSPEPQPAPMFAAPESEPESEPELPPLPASVAWVDDLPVDDLQVDEPYEPELAAVVDEEQAALDTWAEHVTPVAPPPRRHAGIRARLSHDWQVLEDEAAPSLLARLWGWLRGLF